ncbi:MAG TPA: DUF6754 domain-containing protein [Anaerolineales bacterium]|nr:DUF6754 domain-containing protein [Anaerolineales bacterium]
MNLADLAFSLQLLGLAIVVIFVLLMLVFTVLIRRGQRPVLRAIPTFARLGQVIGLAVEAGERLHISLGRGSLFDLPGASALVGFSILRRVAQAASVSDRPPVATSGDGSLALLSQETLRAVYRDLGAANQFEYTAGQLSGLTPFGYAAGTLPVIFDQHVSATFIAGHVTSEAALIADAGERSGSLTLAGTDSLPGQAVLFAAAHEPLIGEELFASGAYLNAGAMHHASVRTQDVFRWLIVLGVLIGAGLKFLGVL